MSVSIKICRRDQFLTVIYFQEAIMCPNNNISTGSSRQASLQRSSESNEPQGRDNQSTIAISRPMKALLLGGIIGGIGLASRKGMPADTTTQCPSWKDHTPNSLLNLRNQGVCEVSDLPRFQFNTSEINTEVIKTLASRHQYTVRAEPAEITAKKESALGSAEGYWADVDIDGQQKHGYCKRVGAETDRFVGNTLSTTSFLNDVGIQCPKQHLIKDKATGELFLFSEKIDGLKELAAITTEEHESVDFQSDYALLTVLWGASDMHPKNMALSDGNLVAIDVDSMCAQTHSWVSRLVDFTEPRIQNYDRMSDVRTSNADALSADFPPLCGTENPLRVVPVGHLDEGAVISAANRFCDVSADQVAQAVSLSEDKGEDSKKLDIQGIQTTQAVLDKWLTKRGLRHAESASTGVLWKDSKQLNHLKHEMRIQASNFLYTAKVEHPNPIDQNIFFNLQRKAPSEFNQIWDASHGGKTEPELLRLAEEGSFSDINLKMTKDTAISPGDIKHLAQLAEKHREEKHSRSPHFADQSQHSKFLTALIMHPSFSELSSVDKTVMGDIILRDRDLQSYASVTGAMALSSFRENLALVGIGRPLT